MIKLLKKELRLCLHPTAPLMILLSSLTLVPNYPYPVSFFYLTLGVFFICLTGRENHDVVFTLALPVGRRDLVKGRFSLVILLELCQLVCMACFILLRQKLSPLPNAAGMDANLALLGEGFLFFGVYHLVFFPAYYRDVSRVGAAFVKSSAVIFFMVLAEIVGTYALPFARDVLDTADPAHLAAKVIFLAVCVCLYLLFTALALRLSVRRFEALDVR